MIVRDFNKLKDSTRAVPEAQWTSVRMPLVDDGMGFSFHITTPKAGAEHTFDYKHQFESVCRISGKGAITDLASGENCEIGPGVRYALDRHDKHTIRADENLVMACRFNPPVTGTEVHRKDGSCAPSENSGAA